MPNDSIAAIRKRAELARRLADQMHSERARRDLFQIADDLEAEVAKLESNIVHIREAARRNED